MKGEYLVARGEGFTLIEVMMTLVILSIGLIALASMQISAMRGNSFSRRMTTAASVAEQVLEQVKNTPYNNVQSQSSTQVSASNMTFNSQVSVTNNTPPNAKTVQVTVTWSDRGKSHNLQLATVISQP
jgi:type IV pilus assembly protein PilV